MRMERHDVGLGAYGVAVAADGTDWTTLVDRGEVVAVRPNGQQRRVQLDSEWGRPMVITCDACGTVYFTRGDGAVGRIDADGHVTSWPVLSSDGQPYGLCLGPDGQSVWYTLIAANRVGRLGPDGEIDEYEIAGGGMPALITSGPDGALWFTLNQANAIGRITTRGEVTTFARECCHPGRSADGTRPGPSMNR